MMFILFLRSLGLGFEWNGKSYIILYVLLNIVVNRMYRIFIWGFRKEN